MAVAPPANILVLLCVAAGRCGVSPSNAFEIAIEVLKAAVVLWQQ